MRQLIILASLATVLATTPTAIADSFAINEYSTADLGRSTSGRPTQTDDAAAAFGNPALMTRYDKITATAGFSAIIGDSDFEDRGSTDVLGQPLDGNTSGFLKDAYVPFLHVVYPVRDNLAFGMSVTAPFGLATDYDDDWPGRYQGLKSELQVININPSVAYAFNDKVSIGFGLDAQYADATLSSAIDFGTTCLGALDPASCGAIGLVPQGADGRVTVEGDSWAIGWNAGLAWSPIEDITLGLTYRSNVDHTLEGSADFEVPTAALPLTASGAFADTGGKADLDLPASLEAGIKWSATDKIDLYASALRMEWSSMQELRVQFDNPAQPDSVEELNYDDSWRWSAGADYKLNDNWKLRAGLTLDETPTQDDFRTVRIPDNDRWLYAVGASWSDSDNVWQIDAAYNLLDFEDVDFNEVGNFNETVTGEYSASVNIFSVSATRRF